MKILIDNGHGRETAGKRSPDGRLLEWSYTREIARRVNDELQRRGHYSSLLVPEDEDIPLSERWRVPGAFAGRSHYTAKPRQTSRTAGAYSFR